MTTRPPKQLPGTIETAASALRAGVCTAEQLVDLCVQRIERHDSKLQAWVVVDKRRARQQALQLDDELRAGRDRGPLHGIPLGIKDLIDVAGLPTRAGSSLRAGHLAHDDAPVVARLRAAGAILLGKTVTTEFACFDPSPSRNPWNERHTPGGSSSGSAVAVVTGCCYAALGTQTGGSITRPASYCGAASFKPAHDPAQLAGIVPVAPTLDHVGPLARSVGDLRLVAEAMSGRQLVDARPSPISFATDRPRWLTVPDDWLGSADHDVQQHWADVSTMLGTTTSDRARLPALAAVVRHHRRIMAYEAAATHRATYPARRAEYGPRISELLDEGRSITPAEYDEALAARDAFRAQVLDLLATVDALVMPATTTAAPGMETTGDARFNAPWSLAGVPVVAVPSGWTLSGLPLAVQLVGHPERCGLLFARAAWCERRLGFIRPEFVGR